MVITYLVIDTNVMRAAKNYSSDEEGKGWFGVLTLVRNNKHYGLALSKQLLEEYFRERQRGKNFSYYITRHAWELLIDLHNRSRTRKFGNRLLSPIENRIVPEIRNSLEKQRQNDRLRAVEKDLHLVILALAADKRIISNDRRLRGHMKFIARDVKELCAIIWPPTLEDTIEWLRTGAGETAEHLLCPPDGA